MKIDTIRIVQPRTDNFTHNYLASHRVCMLHIVDKIKPDKSLCGRTIEGWNMPYRQYNSETPKISITDKDFCKRCLKKL